MGFAIAQPILRHLLQVIFVSAAQPPGARSMKHGKHANAFGYDFVDDQIGAMLDDQFLRAINLANPAQHRLRLEQRNSFSYLTHDSSRRCLIPRIEPGSNRSHIFTRGCGPGNFHSRSNSVNMALTSSSLKSREARPLATFSSSHASSRT